MGRASKRKQQQKQPKDVLGVLYTQRDSILYGAILFFKHTPGAEPTTPYKQSAPFIVSETLGPDEVVVYGSVSYLIEDIRRLIKEVHAQVDELNVALNHLTLAGISQGEKARLVSIPKSGPELRTYFEFTRRLAGTLILLSTQARNLFDLFPRLDRKIALSDAGGQRTGDIKLSNLFVNFVHNQYLILDGEHVSDLFPSNPRPTAPISRTFMGYRFNWVEYVEAIEGAIRDVKLRDLTGLLRGRLRRLSLNEKYSNIVFLIQNLVSFSRLFAKKVPDPRYTSILKLLFEGETRSYLNRHAPPPSNVREQMTVGSAFHAPNIAIHEVLSERKFKVSVRCRWRLFGSDGRPIHEDKDFRNLTLEVGHEQLLGHVSQVFGDDPLLDFRP